MPINETPALPNRHTGYIASSGNGKSQALKQNSDIPRRGVRLIAWDPGRDHKHHCDSFEAHQWQAFVKAVRAGIVSGRGFRLAFVGGQTDWQFFEQQFCRLAWTMLDGRRLTYVIMEELAAVQPSPSVATQHCSLLFNQGRKFGAVNHWTCQRTAEIPKTALHNSENFYIGNPGKFCSKGNEEMLAQVAGCQKAELKQLQKLQFFKVTPTSSHLVQLKYRDL